MALRDFVPGNLIYANGGRFKIALYHFPIGDRQVEMERYQVDTERERISEVSITAGTTQYNGGSQATMLTGLPISDADISYLSRISDEEQNRFQMPVAVLGYLKRDHRGGQLYAISGKEVQHRYGQHVRLVNAGPAVPLKRRDLRYPTWTVSGAARSPYASESA